MPVEQHLKYKNYVPKFQNRTVDWKKICGRNKELLKKQNRNKENKFEKANDNSVH